MMVKLFNVLALCALLTQLTSAQVMPAYGPGPQMPPGQGNVGPAMYGGGCEACDAYGEPISGCENGCCGDSRFSDGFLGNLFNRGCEDRNCRQPGFGDGYGEWGASGGYDQCGPRYWDFSADFLYWKRDKVSDFPVAFTSLGIDGPRILTTDDIEFNYEPAFRVAGRYDLGPSTVVEVIYFGTLESSDTAQVTSSTNQLFSAFSDFGLNPFGGAGFTDTDVASLHRIEYETELHNAEINWRQYWISDDTRLTGTYIIGARYVHLTEDMLFHTEATGQMDYTVAADNDLVGFQIGADADYCLIQGLHFVAEGKTGIYNNRVEQRTNIVATTLANEVVEVVKANTVAMVADARFGAVADIWPNISIRAGYEVMFMTSIATAGNNFNSEPPFLGGTRTPFVDDDSNVLYHGGYAGFEYIW